MFLFGKAVFLPVIRLISIIFGTAKFSEICLNYKIFIQVTYQSVLKRNVQQTIKAKSLKLSLNAKKLLSCNQETGWLNNSNDTVVFDQHQMNLYIL